nr:PepSY domain-containing protein [Marinilabilia sp.]
MCLTGLFVVRDDRKMSLHPKRGAEEGGTLCFLVHLCVINLFMAKGKIFKKLHRWPGLILSFVLLYYGLTGIFLNHREFFSSQDLSRTTLPDVYSYQQWGNSSLKGNLIISPDSILIFGNIGVWATDSAFSQYRSINAGFPIGADNRKVFDLHRDNVGNLYAATQFGLFGYEDSVKEWRKFPLDVRIKRFVAIETVGDSLYVLNRSYLFKGRAQGLNTSFQKVELAQPENFRNEVTLLETVWQLHSGEVFGLPGQFFVDFLGLITIFLSVTGILYFFFPDWIKKRKRKRKSIEKLVNSSRWSLKWHNKTGAWFWLSLAFLFFTGIFLRPPFLILIGYSKVSPIKYSHLDQPNPWYDKLRDIRYDHERELFFLSTSDGMFTLNKGSLEPQKCEIQPPVSVMGITVFERYGEGAWLIGSFSGLFLWHPASPQIIDFPKGEIYRGAPSGRPVGMFKVTGMINDPSGHRYMVDYDQGVLPLYHNKSFPDAPESVVKQTRMSLWNLSLEIHTGRFFQTLLGDFYILIVPLVGLTGVMVVISGYLLYRKRYRRRKRRRINGLNILRD